MAQREILLADSPALRQKAKKIRIIDAGVQRLIDDMIETMDQAHGVGLAAPQVGESVRVLVIRIPESEPIALINPQVVKRSGERILEEGCLSIPGWRGEVKRSVTVLVKALNRDGREIRVKATADLLAQALEHEIDHLDGVLYIDRLTAPDRMWKLLPHEEEGEEGEEGLVGAGSHSVEI
ncbi:MAG: peptide deformylase [Dehalococcoidia bacterium]|nr:peptide deformylase [Dehalococcoidia bacterium]